MFIGVLLFGLAGIMGLLFWVFIGVGIYKLVTKKVAKKFFVTAIVVGFIGGILALSGMGFVSAKIFGSAKEKGFVMPQISYENAKQTWSSKVLKKTSDFDLSIDKIQVIKSEKEWLTYNEAEKEDRKNRETFSKASAEKEEELLGLGNTVSYELTIVVDNHSKNPSIKYKELRKSNLCYIKDENGVFIPAYIINHAEFDDVPWLYTWFLPQYKKDQKVEFVPIGKSYLNVRVEVPKEHTLSKFVFGNAEIDIDMNKLVQ